MTILQIIGLIMVLCLFVVMFLVLSTYIGLKAALTVLIVTISVVGLIVLDMFEGWE